MEKYQKDSFVGKKFVKLTETIFNNIPIIKTIYTPIKDILSNVSRDNNTSFQESVLIEFPQKGMQSIGFITNKNLIVHGESKVSVFIPTTPNPTNGFLIIVDESELTYLDMPIEDGIKSVVSMCTTIEKVY